MKLTFFLVWSFFVGLETVAMTQFDEQSCRTMLPVIKRDKTEEKKEKSENLDDETAAEVDLEHKIQKAGVKPPAKVTFDGYEYRRSRPINVRIEGIQDGEFNGFFMQARSMHKSFANESVGSFLSVSASAMTLSCNSTNDTAMSRDTGGKRNVTFVWKAPNHDLDSIYFEATIIQKDKLWKKVTSKSLTFNPFPPVLDLCGKNMSCYRQSIEPDCSAETCDYLLTSRITETNEIEFTIGGKMNTKYGFIAVGFTEDEEKMVPMDINACVKNQTIDAKHFVVNDWPHGARETNNFLKIEATDVDGDSIWCTFTRPLTEPGKNAMDLTKKLYNTIFTGVLNETTSLPILPAAENITFETNKWIHNDTVNVLHILSQNSVATLRMAVLTMLMSSIFTIFLSHF